MRVGYKLLLLQTTIFLLVGVSAVVLAQSSSTNYQIEESYIGPGGQLDSSSTNYQARASLGDTGVGNSSSANFDLWAGYTTTDDPYLEMVVPADTKDLGVLTDSTTATTTHTFYVRTYLASGYTVTSYSDPPSNNSYSLINLTTPTASSAGTEQFGINLVANTSPATFGANASQFPDGSFSFGFAATGYDTANVYKYVKGDTIAQSNSSSGRTDYTISYMLNIAPLTPGGVYVMRHNLIATSTF